LSAFFEFEIPKGGMAVWAKLHSKYAWSTVAEIARKHKLEIGAWERYDLANSTHNCIRIGFASYNEEEMYELIFRLKKTLNEVRKTKKTS
jgi:GntR family transcriptional regulator/MocR family aminotransferase